VVVTVAVSAFSVTSTSSSLVSVFLVFFLLITRRLVCVLPFCVPIGSDERPLFFHHFSEAASWLRSAMFASKMFFNISPFFSESSSSAERPWTLR